MFGLVADSLFSPVDCLTLHPGPHGGLGKRVSRRTLRRDQRNYHTDNPAERPPVSIVFSHRKSGTACFVDFFCLMPVEPNVLRGRQTLIDRHPGHRNIRLHTWYLPPSVDVH